jgi:hypothetical protein
LWHLPRTGLPLARPSKHLLNLMHGMALESMGEERRKYESPTARRGLNSGLLDERSHEIFLKRL